MSRPVSPPVSLSHRHSQSARPGWPRYINHRCGEFLPMPIPIHVSRSRSRVQSGDSLSGQSAAASTHPIPKHHGAWIQYAHCATGRKLLVPSTLVHTGCSLGAAWRGRSCAPPASTGRFHPATRRAAGECKRRGLVDESRRRVKVQHSSTRSSRERCREATIGIDRDALEIQSRCDPLFRSVGIRLVEVAHDRGRLEDGRVAAVRIDQERHL